MEFAFYYILSHRTFLNRVCRSIKKLKTSFPFQKFGHFLMRCKQQKIVFPKHVFIEPFCFQLTNYQHFQITSRWLNYRRKCCLAESLYKNWKISVLLGTLYIILRIAVFHRTHDIAVIWQQSKFNRNISAALKMSTALYGPYEKIMDFTRWTETWQNHYAGTYIIYVPATGYVGYTCQIQALHAFVQNIAGRLNNIFLLISYFSFFFPPPPLFHLDTAVYTQRRRPLTTTTTD